MKQPGPLTGALVGLLVTAPLIVISTLAYQLAGLPFFVIDLFNFAVKILPGPFVNVSKGTMANLIIALNLGRVDTAAKITEQAIAVVQMLGVGVIVAAAFFAVLSNSRSRSAGVVLGLILGVITALISATTLPLTATTGSPALNAAWNIAACIGWGWVVNWARLYLSEAKALTPVPSASGRGVQDVQTLS